MEPASGLAFAVALLRRLADDDVLSLMGLFLSAATL
jgi:hypothetical protein